MNKKCPECGAKIGKDTTECQKCGYTFYRGVFSDVSEEVEKELSRVTADDLARVAKEKKGNEEKMTLEEFEQMYLAKTKRKKPIQYFRNVVAVLMYEKELKKAYRDYLETLGYDFW